MNVIISIHLIWCEIIFKLFGFYETSIFLSKIGFIYGNKLRYQFYKRHLKSLGDNVLFSYGTILSHCDISIGNNVRLGPYNTIALVDIGDDVMTGQFVHFMSGSNQHGFEDRTVPMRIQPGKLRRIKIGNDVWIGCNSVIMTDVNNHLIVGAGSVVTKLTEEFMIIGGSPAKIIKER